MHKGLADAGAFSNLDWDNPRRMPPSFRSDFRVIAESDSVPRAIELIRHDLPTAVADALRSALLGLDRQPEEQGEVALGLAVAVRRGRQPFAARVRLAEEKGDGARDGGVSGKGQDPRHRHHRPNARNIGEGGEKRDAGLELAEQAHRLGHASGILTGVGGGHPKSLDHGL